ncbi:MAG: iron uptake porin, partial [Calothrix sp. MO_167.B42]|nr:iron uptake porin [Calothrix sp. MO_167.B42]
MSKLLWASLVCSPSFLGATFLLSGTAMASPENSAQKAQTSQVLAQAQPNNPNILQDVKSYSNEGQNTSVSQVTSVSQFSDVQPTDWAFQALQSLVERYGCIAGYPNGTYRGNRALTRYEFAAGLNA